MLATASSTQMGWHRPRRGRCRDGTPCAVRLGQQGLCAGPLSANAAKRGLPLLTAAYKPATPQRPPLCTFRSPGPLKHHGPIP